MREIPTLSDLARERSLLLVRGVLFILLGLAALLVPGLTLGVLLVAVAVIPLLAAAFDMSFAAGLYSRTSHWWVLALEGVLGLTVGVLVLGIPLTPTAWLVLAAALWAAAHGVSLLAVAGRAHRDPIVRAASVLWGWTSLLAAIGALVFWRVMDLAVFLYGLAAFALTWGALELLVGFRLGRVGRRSEPLPAAPIAPARGSP